MKETTKNALVAVTVLLLGLPAPFAQVEPIRVHHLPAGEYFESDEEARREMLGTIGDLARAVFGAVPTDLSPDDPLFEDIVRENLRAIRDDMIRAYDKYLEEDGPGRFSKAEAHLRNRIGTLRDKLVEGGVKAEEAVRQTQLLIQSPFPWVREYGTGMREEMLPNHLANVNEASGALGDLEELLRRVRQRYERDLQILNQLRLGAGVEQDLDQIAAGLKLVLDNFVDILSAEEVFGELAHLEDAIQGFWQAIKKLSSPSYGLSPIHAIRKRTQRLLRENPVDQFGSKGSKRKP